MTNFEEAKAKGFVFPEGAAWLDTSSAEKMAQHINEKFGVEVQLIHREQNIETVLPARD